jgi:hypothetical protein
LTTITNQENSDFSQQNPLAPSALIETTTRNVGGSSRKVEQAHTVIYSPEEKTGSLREPLWRRDYAAGIDRRASRVIKAKAREKAQHSPGPDWPPQIAPAISAKRSGYTPAKARADPRSPNQRPQVSPMFSPKVKIWKN